MYCCAHIKMLGGFVNNCFIPSLLYFLTDLFSCSWFIALQTDIYCEQNNYCINRHKIQVWIYLGKKRTQVMIALTLLKTSNTLPVLQVLLCTEALQLEIVFSAPNGNTLNPDPICSGKLLEEFWGIENTP